MNRGFYGILLIIASAVLFNACRKDPSLPEEKAPYTVTYINPKSIFPDKYGMPALPADNPLTEEGVYLGRMLFYDPVLSIDSSISCSSCHSQQHAFADTKPYSTGVFGLTTNRNAQPLFNLAYSRVFFWDGRQKTLRELVLEPIQAHNEMAMTLPYLRKRLSAIPRYRDAFRKAFNSEPDVFNMTLAMEQFLLTIVSKDSRFTQMWPGNFNILTQEEKTGLQLFNGLVDEDPVTGALRGGADCFHCHGSVFAQANNPNFGGIANNGLDAVITDKGFGGISGKNMDIGTFKTPSLLNISLTAPYMHDGRFATLDEVIDHYSDHIKFTSPNLNPQIKVHGPKQRLLDPQQKAALKAFLLTMTDTVFIKNPAYKNPFK
ncbi:MAG: cytochrome-c peroxidase [Sphingomonadales bacterium]|nr:cytochrome-c peroxidase [Sphingomonadales bacterium]